MIQVTKVGPIVFHQQPNQSYMNLQPIQTLAQELKDWEITPMDYQSLKHHQFFPKVTELSIQLFSMKWNQAEKILIEIKDICFNSLQQLRLHGNAINNIEAIVELKLENLKLLDLKQNRLNKIEALRKCRLPHLQELLVYGNQIRSFESLWLLDCPLLTRIWLNPQPVSLEDLSWAAKLKSNKLKYLFAISGDNKLKCYIRSTHQKLQKRYENLKIVPKLRDDIGVPM